MPKLFICLLWLISCNLHAATLSTRYSYDEAGNKTSQTDALGHVTQWTYSVLNQITSRTLPDGSRESFSYDSTGQLTSHTDFNNQTTRYGYDALNRLILTQYPDGRSVKNTYNASQQLDSVTERQSVNGKIVNQVTKYNYDINDRLVKVTYPNNQSISYSYDAVGNLLTRSTVNGTTKYSYDLNDRLATVTDNQGGLTRLSYDAVGNKTERILANGIKTSWQYNSRNQLTGLSHCQANGTLIADYQYTLDAKGNRTAITETLVNEQGQRHQRQLAYSYDNVDRLTSETVTDSDNAFGGSYSRSYQYDSMGNRSQQIHTANNQSITTTYSYDVNDQLQSETISTTTGSVQTNYRYDQNGNLLEKSNAQGVLAQYRYNTQNQLTEVILPQVTYRYAYDSQGNRIQSQQLKNGQTETTQYLVDTNFNYAEVIEEKDGQGQLLASQTFAPENTGDLLSITDASKESRYTLEDGLGSLRQITNTLGQVQGSQATTAWGESLSNTTKTYTDYGYTGEKQNTETGLVYLRAREYMPSVGRFVQRDTWTGIPTKPVTLNQFVYADANGVNKKDPSGRMTLADVSVTNHISQNQKSASMAIAIAKPKDWFLFDASLGSSYMSHRYMWAKNMKTKQGFGYHVIASRKDILRSAREDIYVSGVFTVIPQYKVNEVSGKTFALKSLYPVVRLTNMQFAIWSLTAAGVYAGECIETDFPYNIPNSNCITWTQKAAAAALAISLLSI